MASDLAATAAGEVRRVPAPVEDLHLVDPPRRLAHHLLLRSVDSAGPSDSARSDGKESLIADPARLPAAGRR